MKDILKGLWKWILAILIILLLLIIILLFRIFVIDRNFDGKSKSSRKNENSSTNSGEGGSLGQAIINGVSTGYNGDEYDYNIRNFDEAFLMYEGKNYEGSVRTALQHLIDNSNGTFYARTSVTAVNFGNNVSIKYNGDLAKYQQDIANLINDVDEGDYDISFKYGGFGTYVNEIVITKK